MGQTTERASQATVDAKVIDSELVDENLLRRLLLRAGRTLAGPAPVSYTHLTLPTTPYV